MTLALASGHILLSPLTGCCAGLEAVGQQAVCATTEADWHGSRLGRCVLSTMRTGLCRNLDGVAVLRNGVASKMAIYGYRAQSAPGNGHVVMCTVCVYEV